ncbi:MAG: hypothetical protein R3D83_03400 [Caenibius sp.]
MVMDGDGRAQPRAQFAAMLQDFQITTFTMCIASGTFDDRANLKVGG